MKYQRSEKLQALLDSGVENKWSTLKKHGIQRCYCILWNRETHKSRQCSREATINGCCSIHAPAMAAADELNRKALEAEAESHEED